MGIPISATELERMWKEITGGDKAEKFDFREFKKFFEKYEEKKPNYYR